MFIFSFFPYFCVRLYLCCVMLRDILKNVSIFMYLFWPYNERKMMFLLALHGQKQLLNSCYCWTHGEINEFEIWSHLLNPFLKGEQHIVGITFVVKASEEGGSQNSETVWQLAVFLLGKALHYQPVVLSSFHSISSFLRLWIVHTLWVA